MLTPKKPIKLYKLMVINMKLEVNEGDLCTSSPFKNFDWTNVNSRKTIQNLKNKLQIQASFFKYRKQAKGQTSFTGKLKQIIKVQ